MFYNFLFFKLQQERNQITIKLISVDIKDKKPRLNAYDTIEIRKEQNGYLTKSFHKIGEYVTTSEGSVKIKIDRKKGYKFLLKRRGFYGSESIGNS